MSSHYRYFVFFLVFLFPLPTQAFVVATDRAGRMLKWSRPDEISFVLYLPEIEDDCLPDRSRIIRAIQDAVDSWSDQAGSALSINLEVAPPGASVPTPGYNRAEPQKNSNIIVFETRHWRHRPGAFAVTLRSYGSNSGNVLHSDIVFNAVDYRWAILDGPSARDEDGRGPVDIQAVATHELGHALGFEHTIAGPSVMRPNVGYGQVWMRNLSDVDLDGLRFLYPAEEGYARIRILDESYLSESLFLQGRGGRNIVYLALLLSISLGGFLVMYTSIKLRAGRLRAGDLADPSPATDNIHSCCNCRVQNSSVPKRAGTNS